MGYMGFPSLNDPGYIPVNQMPQRGRLHPLVQMAIHGLLSGAFGGAGAVGGGAGAVGSGGQSAYTTLQQLRQNPVRQISTMVNQPSQDFATTFPSGGGIIQQDISQQTPQQPQQPQQQPQPDFQFIHPQLQSFIKPFVTNWLNNIFTTSTQ